MEKLFSLSEDNYCFKHDNWIFILDDNRIIGMNYICCQNFINSCKSDVHGDNNIFSWESSETNNSLVSFLNGDFFEYYYIDEISKNDTSSNVFYENNIFSLNY